MQTTIHNRSQVKYIIKAVLFCGVFVLLFMAFSFAKNFIPNNFERLAYGLIGTLAAFLTTVLFLRIDKKKLQSTGLKFEKKTIGRFLVGVVIGIVLMGLLASCVMFYLHEKIAINPNSNFFHFLLSTLPLFPLAYMEELGFRAYPLVTMQDKIGVRSSIIITSILFALYHIANGWSVATSFYGPGIWGLVFGLAAVYSNGIAMPTGIHYAVNLTTSAFGVAGNTVSIWTVEQASGADAKAGSIDWANLLPAFGLLVFAIICLELYMRRKS